MLNKLDNGGWYQGRKIGLLICLDYFPGDAAAGAAALKARLKTQNAVVLHWDAAQLSSTTAAAAAIDATTPYLDGVLVTTGLGFHGNLADMTLEASDKVLQRLMQVNAIGPSLLSQYCAAKMRKAPKSKSPAPTLLMLSSYSGIVGLAHRAAYCSSKFALNGFMETLHAEYQDLRIVLVCPTSVATGFRGNWKKDMARQGIDAKEVAVNQPDLTAEECVAAVWEEFNVDPGYSTAGLKYAILPTGMTSASQWLIRLPWLGEGYIRPKILNRSSKL